MHMPRRQFIEIAAAIGGSAVLPVLAQATFPSKPIQLVVPFSAGGGNDVLARLLAAPLAAQLGQPVVVENRTGAGGNIGANYVVRAPADGHTLLLATNTLTVNPFLVKDLPFDVSKDLAPIGRVANQPLVIVTHPSVPANTVQELVAYLKQNVGKVFYASPGNGTPHHFATEMFKQTAEVFMTHVPYRGAGPALTDLIAGQVQVMFASVISALPFIRDSRIRALATAEGHRIAIMKDLPTVKESGFPDYEATIWTGLMSTAGIPQVATTRLADALAKVVQLPEVEGQLRKSGFEIVAGGPEEMRKLIAGDLKQWGKVASTLGIKPE